MKINISDIDVDTNSPLYMDELIEMTGRFMWSGSLGNILIELIREIATLKKEVKKMKEGEWDGMDN